jgi:hypothetical protein
MMTLTITHIIIKERVGSYLEEGYGLWRVSETRRKRPRPRG